MTAESPDAARETDELLGIEGLVQHFGRRHGRIERLLGRKDAPIVRAVDGVDLTLHRGETLGLVG